MKKKILILPLLFFICIITMGVWRPLLDLGILQVEEVQPLPGNDTVTMTGIYSFDALDAGGIDDTPIGLTTPSTGAFTEISGNTLFIQSNSSSAGVTVFTILDSSGNTLFSVDSAGGASIYSILDQDGSAGTSSFVLKRTPDGLRWTNDESGSGGGGGGKTGVTPYSNDGTVGNTEVENLNIKATSGVSASAGGNTIYITNTYDTLAELVDSGTSKTINSSPSGNSDYFVLSNDENWVGVNPGSIVDIIEPSIDIEEIRSGTSRIFDKSVDEIENILSGTSDQPIFYDANGQAVALDPASAREAMGVVIGSDVQAYDVDTAKIDVANAWTADQTINGQMKADESLGGASAYGIHGDTAFSEYNINGRVGELLASSSPTILLPDISSEVTGVVIIHDITTLGNDSGITIHCSGNSIFEGVGSDATSGDTIFVNTGNTRFKLVLKESTIGWEVWGSDADAINFP